MKHEEIDKIIANYFFCRHEFFYATMRHYSLCTVFAQTPYSELWISFWKEINTNKYSHMNYYLSDADDSDETSALLRLLVVEDFKKYVVTRGK